MPYEVLQNAEGCAGFAVVKVGEKIPIEGGCHKSRSDAMAHMVALNLSYDDETEERDEPNMVAPAYMRASARRGLVLHEQGESGEGLLPQTVEDARKMAEGVALSENKWRKIAPWIARHIDDLDAVQGDEITPGLVAMLLWGGGSTKTSARRAQQYAEQLVARLDDEQRAPARPAPKKDQIFGSDKNPEGSAGDKSSGIDLDAATTTALENKMTDHNKAMTENDRPNWTRVRLGSLKAVWRRGAGAFSMSHRPGVSRAAWAMARVNAFLVLARTGRPANPNYVGDNDLLHQDHPRYSKKEANSLEVVYDDENDD